MSTDHGHASHARGMHPKESLRVMALDVALQDDVLGEPAHWLIRHLTTGRQGTPWCRWVQMSIDNRSFYIADATRTPHGLSIRPLVRFGASTFLETFPLTPRLTSQKLRNTLYQSSLTLLVPAEYDFKRAEIEIHNARPELLKKGIMVGLLHPNADLKPLTGRSAGHPFRSRWPFINFRFAIPEDMAFVGVNPELRRLLQSWVTLYHR